MKTTPDTTGIEEILNDNRKETLFDSDEANEIADDAINNFIVAVLPELANHFHQQLQKARHDWLREEIVRLEELKVPIGSEGYEKQAWDQALQTIIDRYQSELDQDKK